jgi:uncharacterized coiled-coil protein SlyX
MTDKKFTQKDIIKALEVCSSDAFNDSKERCTGCKYDGADKNLFCFEVLEKDALDLINRLKTRIVRYQLKNTNQRNALASLNKKVAEQKVEIDILIRKKETLRDEIAEQQAEIERLKTEKDNLIKTYGECMIEVVKEFAHKILALFPADKNHTTISRFTIKQIVKEMTEVDK